MHPDKATSISHLASALTSMDSLNKILPEDSEGRLAMRIAISSTECALEIVKQIETKEQNDLHVEGNPCS